MIRDTQISGDSPGISNDFAAFRNLQHSLRDRTYLLIAGPRSTLYPQCGEGKQKFSYWSRLFEGMITWCVEHSVIEEQNIENEFRYLLHREAWFPLGYRLEEYLVDKVELQNCLKDVLLPDAQPTDLQLQLASLPFCGFLSTMYDTNLEIAYERIHHRKLTKFYPSSMQDALEAYQRGQPFIVKLYGDVEQASSLVFGHRWSKALSGLGDHALLRTLLLASPVLFFGFDDDDPDYKCFKSIVNNYSPFNPISLIHLGNAKKQEPQDLHSLKQYGTSRNIIQSVFPTLFNVIPTPISQVSAPTQVSTDSHPQNVQTSPSFQDLQRNETLTMGQSISDGPPSMEVYIAYAHQDEDYFEDIKGLMRTITRQVQGCEIYCLESEVLRDREWERERYLTTAHLILLLVSRHFLDSDFCYCEDMKNVVAEQMNGNPKVCIMPIIVKFAETQLKGAPFGGLKAFPTDRTPIDDLSKSNKERIYDQIFDAIMAKIEKLKRFLKRY